MAQRHRHASIRTGRAAQRQIDTAGEQRIQRAELLGDLQRGVVGQHDPARSDADAFRRPADMGQHHRCRRAAHALHAVMLGHPIAVVSGAFGMGGQAGGIGQSLAEGAPVVDGDQIEDGEGDGGCHVSQSGERKALIQGLLR